MNLLIIHLVLVGYLLLIGQLFPVHLGLLLYLLFLFLFLLGLLHCHHCAYLIMAFCFFILLLTLLSLLHKGLFLPRLLKPMFSKLFLEAVFLQQNGTLSLSPFNLMFLMTLHTLLLSKLRATFMSNLIVVPGTNFKNLFLLTKMLLI